MWAPQAYPVFFLTSVPSFTNSQPRVARSSTTSRSPSSSMHSCRASSQLPAHRSGVQARSKIT